MQSLLCSLLSPRFRRGRLCGHQFLYGHRNFQDKMRGVEGFDKMIYTPTPLVPKRGWLVILFFSVVA